MNLNDYISSKTEGKQKAIPAEIRSKFEQRNGLSYAAQGERGAIAYIRQFGKGLGAPKAVFQGRLALEAGFPEFAAGFFKKAAELEGVTLEVSDVGNTPQKFLESAAALVRQANVDMGTDPRFPRNMQPGRFAAMQPSDAKHDRSYYINDDCYWGQPKKDGEKLIVFVTRDEVYYQSRQMKLNGMPDAQMDNVLRDFARLYGNFVLEGELTFLDYAGNEHMSGAQALEINQRAGYDRHLPVMKYYVFNCIWREGWPEGMNYGQMVDEGTKIAEALSCTCSTIEAVPTYGTVPNKSAMALKQDNQGREGEVFFDPSMPYTPGKNTNDTFVRTKYYVEFPAWVIGFTPTTAAGHAFGAMTIQSLDGDLLGNIGTGFTRDEKRQLLARFQAEGSFQVEIRSQRMSEYGRTRHGRFLRIL